MEVTTRNGGDGVACWNVEAITAHAQADDARQAQLVAGNRDLVVLPGQIRCHGCVTLQYGNGWQCTAGLTRTRYAVRDEIQPRAADAAAPATTISGLCPRLEAESSSVSGAATEELPTQTEQRRSRAWFSR